MLLCGSPLNNRNVFSGKPLFELGQVVATPGALEALTNAGNLYPAVLLDRHVQGDWGDLDAEDKQVNEDALRDGDRILSSYKLQTGVTIWIVTEYDRSVSTLLLPSEY